MANKRARELRNNATDAERIFWARLRYLKHHGLHFRRQVPIGKYIVDFACHGARLDIELDGSQHDEPAARRYDAVRTEFLKSQGYRALRYWNVDAIKNSQGIADAILTIVKETD